MEKIAELIRNMRKSAGMSQSQLDDAADLPMLTVGRAERANGHIKTEYFFRIAEATGHDVIIRRKDENDER